MVPLHSVHCGRNGNGNASEKVRWSLAKETNGEQEERDVDVDSFDASQLFSASLTLFPYSLHAPTSTVGLKGVW